MLEIVTQANLLKNIVHSIDGMVCDVNFYCTAKGLSLQAVDSTKGILMALLLKANGFQSYRCDKYMVMGVNLNNLSNILKFARADDTLTLSMENESKSVNIKFKTQGNAVTFEMKLKELKKDQLEVQSKSHLATMRMPSAEFARICEVLCSIGDIVEIFLTETSVKFSTSGESGTVNIIRRQDDKSEIPTIVEMNEAVNLPFLLKYLTSFTKATPLSKTVAITLYEDYPMVVEYKIGEMGHLRYYLGSIISKDPPQP